MKVKNLENRGGILRFFTNEPRLILITAGLITLIIQKAQNAPILYTPLFYLIMGIASLLWFWAVAWNILISYRNREFKRSLTMKNVAFLWLLFGSYLILYLPSFRHQATDSEHELVVLWILGIGATIYSLAVFGRWLFIKVVNIGNMD